MGSLAPFWYKKPRVKPLAIPLIQPDLFSDFEHSSDLDVFPTTYGGWSIAGGRLTGAGAGGFDVTAVSCFQGRDCFAEAYVTVEAEVNYSWAGLFVRHNGLPSPNMRGYYFNLQRDASGNHRANLSKPYVASLAKVAYPWVAGTPYKLRVEVAAATIRCYINDALVIGPIVDSDYTSGYVSLNCYNVNAGFDNLTVKRL